jgi:gamma-glutamyl-gamma-aminobutyrate hydrolase PuuD
MHYFQQFGKVFMVTPDSLPEHYSLDMLVLPGGADLSLALQSFGQMQYRQGSDNPSYTQFAERRLGNWIASGVPIFGICLGMQMLLNKLGARLNTHIDNHSGTTHYIVTETRSGISEVPLVTEVNSRHHQGLTIKKYLELPEATKFNIIPVAYSLPFWAYKYKEEDRSDKLVAAIHKKGIQACPEGTTLEAFKCIHETAGIATRIAGVQWHPEDLTNTDNVTRGDEISARLIKWLLESSDIMETVGVPVRPNEDGAYA